MLPNRTARHYVNADASFPIPLTQKGRRKFRHPDAARSDVRSLKPNVAEGR